MVARDDLGEWPRDDCGAPADGRKITNIVLMGMGEPLYNYENVATAMRLPMDQEGLSTSTRNLTLSTSGVVTAMARIGREPDLTLAVSLRATTCEGRERIMQPP